MASRKNDPNSSKTAHVMNLLSRGRGNPSAASSQNNAPDDAVPDAAPMPAAPASQPSQPQLQAPHISQSPPREAPAHSSPVISIMNADANASSAIKDALEAALLAEEDAASAGPRPEEEPPAPAEPRPEEEPSAPAEPTQEEEPSAPAEPTPEEEPSTHAEPTQEEEPSAPAEPTPEEEPSAPAEPTPEEEPSAPVEPTQEEEPSAPAEPMPEDEPPAPAEPVPPAPDFTMVNVMEFLVEEAVDRYIKMFGLCDCPRCRADVVAESLSNLIPKYVVMGRNEANPRLALYRSRYSAAVTAQILRACKVVMDDPRH